MLYHALFDDILSSVRLNPETERSAILNASRKFLGYTYQRTEDLAVDTIDCSTLTSQSYWLGALLNIPFTAEGQRTGSTGLQISEGELLPADIVVKYPSLNDSPDKTWNHVGLYLGEFKNNKYVIESNSKSGCIISTLDQFSPNGGFRRYLQNDNIYVSIELHSELQKLAINVPKLGRLGAKQYSVSDTNVRFQHHGIDIYTELGSKVNSPMEGRIQMIQNRVNSFNIVSLDGCTTINLENIEIDNNLSTESVSSGQYIGQVSLPSNKHICYDEKFHGNHLHFEVSGNINSIYKLPFIEIGTLKYYNGLYLAKLSLIKPPL